MGSRTTPAEAIIFLLIAVLVFAYGKYESRNIDYESERQVELKLDSIETYKNSTGKITGHRLTINLVNGDKREIPIMWTISPLPKAGNLLPFSVFKVKDSPDKYVFRFSKWKEKQFDF